MPDELGECEIREDFYMKTIVSKTIDWVRYKPERSSNERNQLNNKPLNTGHRSNTLDTRGLGVSRLVYPGHILEAGNRKGDVHGTKNVGWVSWR